MPYEEKWIIFVLIVVLVIFGLQYKQGGFGGPNLSPQDKISNFLFPRGFGTVPNRNPEITNTNNTGAVAAPELVVRSSRARSSNPSQEYIILDNTGPNNIAISGLKVRNKRNEEATIPGDENGNPISLNKRERAVIVTGQSPMGFNFKLNECSAYLNNSQNFVPQINSTCRSIKELPGVQNLKDQCRIFINRMPSCQIPSINANSNIDDECAQFLAEHASYQGCVNDFKNEPGFDQREWRIYLGRSQEFWDNNYEIIQLIDPSGKVVSETSY